MRRWAVLAAVAAIPVLGSPNIPEISPALSAVRLAQIRWAGLTISKATWIPAGYFKPEPGGTALGELPAFCRVVAVLRPVPGSNIRIELWLPQRNWNGRLLGIGNGGGAGQIVYGPLATGLKLGYAAANTDLGTAPDAEMAVGHPERWTDFGYRATHEMTAAAKALTQAFYGRPPHHAYFVGGSTGGQQALMEAQRFPDDYDGIIAGAPGNNRTHLHAMFIWNWLALHQEPDNALPPEKIATVAAAVIKARSPRDGGAPGR